MRRLKAVFTAKRCTVVLALMLAGSAVFLGAERKSLFTPHEKAYYADPQQVQFVRPGLVIGIVSAAIAPDGTISVEYKLTDPSGLPLDQSGVVTPGPVTLSFLAAYIPKGQEQYTSYIVRTATAASGGATATQAAADSGGTTTTVATGDYIYTYGTKAPAGFDPTDTNRIGIYGSRNLTEFDLGTNYADATYDFVPAGGTPTPQGHRAHSRLQPVPRAPERDDERHRLGGAGGARRFAARRAALHHLPPAADLRSQYRQHARYEGVHPQNPRRQLATERPVRNPIPDCRVSELRERLVHGGLSG